jgi:hypothetical protein
MTLRDARTDSEIADWSRRIVYPRLAASSAAAVCKLGPLAFDHGPHFIRDMVDVLDLQHVLRQPFQIRRHHHLVADDAGLIGTALFDHSRRQLLANAVMAASRVSA